MKKLSKFVVVGDSHGDTIHAGMRKKLFAFMDDFKPMIVIHGGDLMNLAALRKGASESEKRIDLGPDWASGADFFNEYFSYGRSRFFLRGNHDERIYNVAKNASSAPERMYAQHGVSDLEKMVGKRRVTMLPYDSRQGVFDWEGIRGIHGYACGVTAARKLASIYGNCFYCHTHSIYRAPYERWPEVEVAYGTGALCEIDQDYNSTQTNKLSHENGFIYGYTDGSRATYFQACLRGDTLFAAPEIKAY